MPNGFFNIKVGGEFACFTRPEFKTERVSYPVITPSAARGICEAVFWKPEVRWEIREIAVLRPIRQIVILRNEIKDRQARQLIYADDPKQRQQRASLVLRDVEYVIRAELLPQPHCREPMAKYTDQAQRRLERGQCHHMPYLGTREFSAWFEPARGDESPAPIDLDVGLMLFDIAYRPDGRRREIGFWEHDGNGRRESGGFIEAIYFDAPIRSGVLAVPPEKYREKYEWERRNAS
jgi:CRISPR-associated protein Cas5d